MSGLNFYVFNDAQDIQIDLIDLERISAVDMDVLPGNGRHFFDQIGLYDISFLLVKVPQKDVLRIIGETHATIIGDAIILAMYDKTMEMQVFPPHNELKNTMETGNTGVVPDQQSAPDHRTYPIKMKFYLVNFNMES